MRTLTGISLAAVVALGISTNARALTITADVTASFATGSETGVPQILQEIYDDTGLDIRDASSELYKQDVGAGSDSGSFSSSYSTTFSNTASDPEDALIEYVGGPSITGQTYLLVKDGNASPAWYLYDLTALLWDGVEDITLQDFWDGSGKDGQGAISHVSLYGGGGSVPDAGGTLALLGLAIGTLSLLRRKRA